MRTHSKYRGKMNETELYDAIFDRSRLVLTDEDRAKLRRATVALSGLGGIGGIIAEELVRSGIGHLKLSDPDVFEPTNFGRQLYATTKTLGLNKAEVAKERILEINPYCKVDAYTEGIQKENVLEILEGVDVLIDEVDFESRKLIQHRAAKKLRIPVVHAARAGFPENRWTVQVRVWNFRTDPELETLEESNRLWTRNLTWDELTDDVLDKVDKEIALSRKYRLREEILNGNTSSFGYVPKEYLLSQLNGDLAEPFRDDLFDKRAIFVQIPNIAGVLASLEAVKLILGWKTTTYKLDLLRGQLE
jgi:molybdopterin/thiamine biosynthesis adenylyltransferase